MGGVRLDRCPQRPRRARSCSHRHDARWRDHARAGRRAGTHGNARKCAQALRTLSDAAPRGVELSTMDAHQDFGRRWFEEIWNQKRREAIDEMLASDAVIHDGGRTVRGAEEFYQFFDRMQGAFSDVHVTVQETIVQDDKICVRWSCRMTHTGAGLGMPATGKVLDTTGISIFRVASG